ncbi:hypothetical protein TYRP_015162, partial [Tyrophagus putrescentiae]
MKLHLKVLHWVNIYQNTENIRHYCGDLENLPRRSSAVCRRSRAIFAVLALKTAHFYYLFTARGLTELQRLLHFDFTVLIRATPNLNCLSFAMLLLNLVAFYLLFWFDFQKTPTDVKGLANRGKRLAPAYLVSQVYCQQNSKSFLFRREESDQNQQHQQQQQNRKSKKGASVISVIEKWMRQVSFLIDIYVSAIITLLYLYLFINYFLLLTAHWEEIFDSSSSSTSLGLLTLLFSLSNGVAFVASINAVATLHGAFFILNIIFTVIVFLRFKQCNQLLDHHQQHRTSRTSRTSKSPRSSHHYLLDFARYHNETLGLILVNNLSFGRMILAYILVLTAVNSYLFTLLFKSTFDLVTTVLMGNIASLMWTLIGGLHILASMFHKRIHSPCGRLFGISSRIIFLDEQNHHHHHRKSTSLVVHLKLANYISRICTWNRYGVTYGKMGLISAKSFQKFLLIYFKLFVYWWKLN